VECFEPARSWGQHNPDNKRGDDWEQNISREIEDPANPDKRENEQRPPEGTAPSAVFTLPGRYPLR
jgi:hypothetical protein